MTVRNILCACPVCWVTAGLDDDHFGKAIARAAEHDDTDPCD